MFCGRAQHTIISFDELYRNVCEVEHMLENASFYIMVLRTL